MPERLSVPDLIFGEALKTRPRGITTVGLALRIAVASTASYFLARQISQSSFVLFAPVTTLLVVQASPFATIGASMQRVLGTGLGVLLATIFVQFIPVNAATFFAAVFVALLFARLLPVSLAAQLQIPVAVVFVLALGSTGFRQDAWRVLDVVIGGAVGIVAVYLIPSRPRLELVEAAIEDFLAALQLQLRAIGDDVGTVASVLPDKEKHHFTATSRQLRDKSRKARDEYIAAVESLRFHPRARREARRLEAIGEQVSWLTGLAIQVRAISGAADRLFDRVGGPPALSPAVVRDVMGACADLIEVTSRAESEAEMAEVRAEAKNIRALINPALTQIVEGAAVTDVLHSLSLLGRLDLLCDSILRRIGLDAEEDDHFDAVSENPNLNPVNGGVAASATGRPDPASRSGERQMTDEGG